MSTEGEIYYGIPVLPLRGLVIYPGSVLHFDVARDDSVLALSDSMKNSQHIFITSQKDPVKDDPELNDLYEIGVYSQIMQIARLTENYLRVVIRGISRAKVIGSDTSSDYMKADIVELKDTPSGNYMKIEALTNMVRDAVAEYALNNTRLPQDLPVRACDIEDAGKLSDFIGDNFIRDFKDKQKLLEILDEEERLSKAYELIAHEIRILEIENDISEKTREKIELNQKEYYLKERLRAIKDELGDTDDFSSEAHEYREKIKELKTNDENKEKLIKEVVKLEKMISGSAEANVVRSYLDTCIELPWGKYTKEKIDIKRINAKLDKNHYGLKKVKENIVEALAVRKLNPDVKGQIICLAGPPGVGKTSIAHSVADAVGRNYQRIALGGIHDEAEIRGHRRTYIGAMMGRIMYAINQAQSSNPLILLDELDKLGNDYHGDPTSALLEVLDGEQNSTFFDHYIAPLLDRMDIIHIDSYTREEKFQIAKRHLVSKQLKFHGLSARNFKITDEAIYDIIDSYTRESGVRNLERFISKLMNKTAVKIVAGETKSIRIDYDNLEEYLGSRKYKLDTLNKKNEVGLATGLAWTSVGGETLPIEVAVMNGSGKIELTGSLGDVMKESAFAAFTCVRSMSDKLNIDPDFYKNKDIHIHVPEGAVPKDGPSAGITMATAITSALTGRPVRRDIAMTGEITIRGSVLPIGGLKEKTMAAYRLGIKTVIIPKENKSDLDEVDPTVKENINFILADNINTVFDNALAQPEN